jgi:hypothetical protein
MHVAPIQASQEIRPSVRILASDAAAMAATATKTAVHVALLETAFKPIEVPSMPDPVTNIQSAQCEYVSHDDHANARKTYKDRNRDREFLGPVDQESSVQHRRYRRLQDGEA